MVPLLAPAVEKADDMATRVDGFQSDIETPEPGHVLEYFLGLPIQGAALELRMAQGQRAVVAGVDLPDLDVRLAVADVVLLGELLAQIGVPFVTLIASIDETALPGEPAERYVERLAREKAQAGLTTLKGKDQAVVLGADTAVVLDGRILGKPESRADALATLAALSGREHQVLTAVALVDAQRSAEAERFTAASGARGTNTYIRVRRDCPVAA